MELNLPLYIESRREPDTHRKLFRAALLFHPQFHSENEMLQKALQKLTERVRMTADRQGRSARHDALCNLAYAPEVTSTRLKLRLTLKHRIAKTTLLFVEMPAFGRRLAFTPRIPQLWFELRDGERLEARATDVLQNHFREQEREDEGVGVSPESLSLTGEAWLSTLDVDVRTDQRTPKEEVREFMSLWGNQDTDGAEELRKVGRCIDDLYPDRLERTIGRVRESRQLDELLQAPDRRPVLVVGDHQVGKTALIHEAVFRHRERMARRNTTRGSTWLLSPGRLISGMSYVGQWENRLIAILDEARRRRHLLYFDDLLGLFQAGKSRDSELCMADVIKPRLQNREVRLLGEITPDALHRLAEMDRGFADLFQVVRLDEMDQAETMRVLIHVSRESEFKSRCIIGHDVLPLIVQLHRRFRRDARFPGKAAGFLKNLAVKNRNHFVTRESALSEFRSSTGLSLDMVDEGGKLTHRSIRNQIGAHLIGQREAIEACADLVTVSRARLNDTSRPVGTMMFVGPTGVGKTECAKALCKFMFAGEDQLIRFDMNEYKSAHAASRLVGDARQPEGLLTSAVRYRPHCIVLLDEIEKAHPDVFDILLQLTGEGRLTDALGRTTDFTCATIIMTSNLGTKESAQRIALSTDDRQQGFVKAAERFFRPEFFNRIDRIVTFHPLSRGDIRQIAERLISQMVQREGILRRRCILQIDPEALESVVDLGYHPQLGARALKRELERQLAQPIANELAKINPSQPTLIAIRRESEALDISVSPLSEASPVNRIESIPNLASFHRAATTCVDRVRREIHALRPSTGYSTGEDNSSVLHYYALDDQCKTTVELISNLADDLQSSERPVPVPEIRTTPRSRTTAKGWSSRPVRLLHEMTSANDISSFIQEAVLSASGRTYLAQSLALRIAQELALAEEMLRDEPQTERVAYWRCAIPVADDHPMIGVYDLYCRQLAEKLVEDDGFDVDSVFCDVATGREGWLRVIGPFANSFLRSECGTHLFTDQSGQMFPMQLGIIPLERTAEFSAWMDKRLDSSSQSGNTHPDPPRYDFPLEEVIRVYHQSGQTLDVRTGLSFDRFPSRTQLRALSLATLPIPKELEETLCLQ